MDTDQRIITNFVNIKNDPWHFKKLSAVGRDTYTEKEENHMKKTATMMIAAVMCVMCFAGCDKYTSKYNAVAFVHSNEAHTASMSFSEFEGTMVFKLESKGSDTKLSYSAKLEKGSAKISYDCDGTKKGLYTVKEGEKTKASANGLNGETIYIIVETTQKCENGEMSFEIA